MSKAWDLPDEIRQLGEAYLVAFNTRDFDGYVAVLHFPYITINGVEVAVIYEPDGLHPGMFDYMEEMGWDRSVWESAKLIQKKPGKVHVAVSFTRRRKDDSVLEANECVYVMTHENGRWGIKATSLL